MHTLWGSTTAKKMIHIPPVGENSSADSFSASDCPFFISLCHRGDLVRQKRCRVVRTLLFHLIGVKETHFALLVCFYVNHSQFTLVDPEAKSHSPVPIANKSLSAIEYVRKAIGTIRKTLRKNNVRTNNLIYLPYWVQNLHMHEEYFLIKREREWKYQKKRLRIFWN